MKAEKSGRKSVVKSVGEGRLSEYCDWSGCTAKAGSAHFVFGNAYCPEHYYLGLEKNFLDEFNIWSGREEPTKKFLNLFSRYVEDTYWGRDEIIPRRLNTTRLKGDIFDIKKKKICIEFSIIRHPYLRSDPSWMREIEQRWRFNIKTKKLRLLKSTRIR